MHVLTVKECSLEDAPGVGMAILGRAQSEGVPWLACRVVVGAGVALGAVQRAGAVLDMVACAQRDEHVVRRSTTGTAAWLGGTALWWSLALPTVDALVTDATARTVLNRNVRGFLQGFNKVGAQAMYAGREWIAVQRRPCALLGLQWATDGAVLIDVIAGWNVPVALPRALQSDREKDTEHWRGTGPLALGEVIGTKRIEDVGRVVMESVATRAGQAVVWVDDIGPIVRAERVVRADDPLPEGFVIGPGVRVPIGWVDAAAPVDPTDRRAWLGGDMLAGTADLAAMAAGAVGAAGAQWGNGPLEGALASDLAHALAHVRSA